MTTLHDIVRLTARAAWVSPAELCRDDRRDSRVTPWRQAGMALAWEQQEAGVRRWSLNRIVRAFGRKDHATVIHAVERAGLRPFRPQRFYEVSPELQRRLTLLRAALVDPSVLPPKPPDPPAPVAPPPAPVDPMAVLRGMNARCDQGFEGRTFGAEGWFRVNDARFRAAFETSGEGHAQ